MNRVLEEAFKWMNNGGFEDAHSQSSDATISLITDLMIEIETLEDKIRLLRTENLILSRRNYS